MLLTEALRNSWAKFLLHIFNRIVKAIQELRILPRPAGCKKLAGRPGYRIRIGDYRVINKIEDKILTVYIIDIGHRKDIYD